MKGKQAISNESHHFGKEVTFENCGKNTFWPPPHAGPAQQHQGLDERIPRCPLQPLWFCNSI